VCGLLYSGWLQKSYPANDIKLWGKKLVKQVTLSDLTVVRKTLSFSKKLENHIGAIWNFIHHYNASLPIA
jgi:hypothetical protein